jgi:inorganic pyrophosphatase
VIAVPSTIRIRGIHDIGDLPKHALREIEHFFQVC